MLSEFIAKNFVSQAAESKNGYVKYGYGQVEPNHLSAQRNGKVYAQLPANKDIEILEQGQFVKYDYAAANGGEVNFNSEAGEWMLVYNEIKLYREHQMDCEFAMLKDNYQARVYSPYDWEKPQNYEAQSRYYNANDVDGGYGADSTKPATAPNIGYKVKNGEFITKLNGTEVAYPVDDVTAAPDPYEPHYNEDPYHILSGYKSRRMPAGTTMVPRVFKTDVGDIFTTNMIMNKVDEIALGDKLSPRAADGILSKTGDGTMEWQVVRVYTMPDGQPGVKLRRIK